MTVQKDSSLKFSWSEHNCETLMVDPHGELYIVSKVHGGRGKMVHLPSSSWGSSHRVSVHDGIHLDIHTSRNDPVGGDISPSGYEVLIKTLDAVNYYFVPDGNYMAALKASPIHIQYQRERQGESIGWERNGQGFYTLSEGTNKDLYFHKRIAQANLVG